MPASGKVKHGCKRRGVRPTPEYSTWLGMKSRCYTPSNKDYPNWGGRGIKVCDEWVNDFMQFHKDMGDRPSSNHTIDRLDSSKDYSPSNCRWATREQQGAENRRGLIPVTIGDLHFTSLKSACLHFGVNLTTAHYRISNGIPIDIAVTTNSRLKSRRDKKSYLRKSLR